MNESIHPSTHPPIEQVPTLLVGMATMCAADGDFDKLTRTAWAPSNPPNMLCTAEASRRALLDPFERLAGAVEVAVTKPLKSLQFVALDEVRDFRRVHPLAVAI